MNIEEKIIALAQKNKKFETEVNIKLYTMGMNYISRSIAREDLISYFLVQLRGRELVPKVRRRRRLEVKYPKKGFWFSFFEPNRQCSKFARRIG